MIYPQTLTFPAVLPRCDMSVMHALDIYTRPGMVLSCLARDLNGLVLLYIAVHTYAEGGIVQVVSTIFRTATPVRACCQPPRLGLKRPINACYRLNTKLVFVHALRLELSPDFGKSGAKVLLQSSL